MTSHLDKNIMIAIHMRLDVSFNMQGILQTRYYNLGKENPEKYLVQTWSQAKSSGRKLPEVHGHK